MMTASAHKALREAARSRELVYVSITGVRLKARRFYLAFWWHALRSYSQAQRAHGNISVEARFIGGVHHTRTVWIDEDAMRRYLLAGAHLKAMRAFKTIATGKTSGFYASTVPTWEEVLALWDNHSEGHVGDRREDVSQADGTKLRMTDRHQVE